MTEITPCDGFAEDYSAYLDGELEPGRSDELAAHFEACALCNERLDALRGVDVLLREAPAPLPASDLYERLQSRIAEDEVRPPATPLPLRRRRRSPSQRTGGRRTTRTGFGIAGAAAVAAGLALLLLPTAGPESTRRTTPEEVVANTESRVAPVPTPEDPGEVPEVPDRVLVAEEKGGPAVDPVGPAPSDSDAATGQLLASFDDSSADQVVEIALTLDLDTIEDFDVIANLGLLERLVALDEEAS